MSNHPGCPCNECRITKDRNALKLRLAESRAEIERLERKVEILSGGVTGEMVTENRCLRGYVAMLFQLIDANSKSWGHAEIAAVDRVRAAFEALAWGSE